MLVMGKCGVWVGKGEIYSLLEKELEISNCMVKLESPIYLNYDIEMGLLQTKTMKRIANAASFLMN